MSSVIATLTSTGDPRSLKSGIGVQTATLGKINGDMNAVEKVVCQKAGDTGLDSLPGDEWYRVEGVTLIGKVGLHDGWVAVRHKGQKLCNVSEIIPAETMPVTVTVKRPGYKTVTVIANLEPDGS